MWKFNKSEEILSSKFPFMDPKLVKQQSKRREDLIQEFPEIV